jgi:predicted TIM-barrel fold metal-dependent hydrolase
MDKKRGAVEKADFACKRIQKEMDKAAAWFLEKEDEHVEAQAEYESCSKLFEAERSRSNKHDAESVAESAPDEDMESDVECDIEFMDGEQLARSLAKLDAAGIAHAARTKHREGLLSARGVAIVAQAAQAAQAAMAAEAPERVLGGTITPTRGSQATQASQESQDSSQGLRRPRSQARSRSVESRASKKKEAQEAAALRAEAAVAAMGGSSSSAGASTGTSLG